MVLPSMLAALGAADADRPTLVVKVDARTTSIAILDKNQLLLFRTLENPRGVTITGEQLAEEVYPSVVFFQDTYHLNIEHIFVAGSGGRRRSCARTARADRRGGHRIGREFAIGCERRFDSKMENGRGGGGPAFVDARRYQSRDSALRGCAALLAALGRRAGRARHRDPAAADLLTVQWAGSPRAKIDSSSAIPAADCGPRQREGRRASAAESAPEQQHPRPFAVPQRSFPAQGLFLDQGFRRPGAGHAATAARDLDSSRTEPRQ